MQKQPKPLPVRPATSLSETAYARIEEMIVTLELQPGTLFSEAELRQKLGIGRTPVREALQRLARENLVAILPRRGMVITDINLAAHFAILETRRVLDRLIAGRAARRATPAQRAALRECACRIRDTAAAGDLQAFMRLDRRVDRLLEAAARNTFAARACAPLHAHCRRFWYYYHRAGDLTASAALHAAVLETVAEGDEAAAAQAAERLCDYLEQFARTALETF